MKKLLLFLLALLPLTAAGVLAGAVVGPWFDEAAPSWPPALRFWLLIAALVALLLVLPLYAATALYFRRADKGSRPSWVNLFLLLSVLVGLAVGAGAVFLAPVPPETLVRERAGYLPRALVQNLSGGSTTSVPDAETFARLVGQSGEEGKQATSEILLAVLDEGQFTVDLELEAHGARAGKAERQSLGTGLVAIDLRGGDKANQRLELHVRNPEPDRREAVDAVLVARGTKAFLWLEQPGQEALALKLDLAPFLRAAEGSDPASLLVPGEQLAELRAELERLRENPREALARRGASAGTARLVDTGVLALRPRDSTAATLLYFDPSSHLPQMLVARDPESDAILALRMTDWRRGGSVDPSLPLPEERYVDVRRELMAGLGLQLQQLGSELERWGKALGSERD